MALYAQQSVGLGTVPNDDTGDDLRAGGDKINDNNDEIFGATDYDAGGAKVWVNEAGGIAQSQQGIKFGGTATANLIDDTEFGTFTPTLQDASNSDAEGQTYTTQVGRFTKIGDIVHVSIQLVVLSLGTLSGPVQIAGLPFLPNSALSQSAYVGLGQSLVITAGTTVTGRTSTSLSVILLELWDATTGVTSLDAAEFSANGTIVISSSYKV